MILPKPIHDHLTALELAISQTLADPERAEQVQWMLKDNDRITVGGILQLSQAM
jgi:hypothetical protein